MAGAGVDFALVGAQRAGSTHLAALLADHPQLYLCGDEVPFFEDPFFPNSDPAELAAALAPARPGQRRGIHCPSYLCRPEVTGRLAAHAPRAGVLVVLREPVARAISAWYWYVQYAMVPLEPAEAGLRRLLDGEVDDHYPQAPEVLAWSHYADHIERWLGVFGDRVLAMRHEDLADAATHRALYRHLGVDDAHRPAPGVTGRNPGVYDLRRLRWLRTRAPLAWSWAETDRYRYRPRRRRKPLRFALNGAMVATDRLVGARLLGNRAPAISAGLRHDLAQQFAPDIARLEVLLGRDLPGWPAWS